MLKKVLAIVVAILSLVAVVLSVIGFFDPGRTDLIRISHIMLAPTLILMWVLIYLCWKK